MNSEEARALFDRLVLETEYVKTPQTSPLNYAQRVKLQMCGMMPKDIPSQAMTWQEKQQLIRGQEEKKTPRRTPGLPGSLVFIYRPIISYSGFFKV
ncbi:hypothetical protein Ndes2526B_g04360 [Nannochloris sp. 'desiccata']